MEPSVPNPGPRDGLAGDRRRLEEVVRTHWGFTSLRPLQAEAMEAVLAGRDSLLVLPTGGGKSLCYQAPAVLTRSTTVVISPLIALMKDQVDAALANGVPAVQFNSANTAAQLQQAERQLLSGAARLVFASPERMATPLFRRLLQQAGVRNFAIDEAHCISHWGHDFRPEYRLLREIKDLFPQASVHAFTATATSQVREDIVQQLALREAEVLVGNFDRPNLTYRVAARTDLFAQVADCLARHPGEAGIIYCIRRRDVDELVAHLKRTGIAAQGYHAGLTQEQRQATQEAFIAERCDVIVATVAFGMGIDRSNVRFVMHTGLPKSIEHYQQEAGRAGRDGLEAECLLLYGGEDAMTWRMMFEKSIEESAVEVDPAYRRSVLAHIDQMEKYCQPVVCRHRTLVAYFGQQYPHDNCGACDVCLGDQVLVPDGQTIAKKILSCVARVKENFGVRHVANVLRGERHEAVLRYRHEQLSTFGLLSESTDKEIGGWIRQLVAQLVLETVAPWEDKPDVRVLKLNAASWEVMRDQRQARLVQLPQRRSKKTNRRQRDATAAGNLPVEYSSTSSVSRAQVDADLWAGVDRDLFEKLRATRRELATAKGMPPYIVCGDKTLRDLARRRPSSLASMRQVYGLGALKLAEYGAALFEIVDAECTLRQLTRDVTAE